MADHFTFIVSGGRTGTQFLGDLLSEAIDDCYSEHEPDIFRGLDRESFKKLRRFGVWNMVVGRALGLTGVRVIGTRYLKSKDDLQATTRRLRAQRRVYHLNVPQRLLVESYYAWWMVSPLLSQIFPRSNVVGVIRDPRNWIASWCARATGRANGHWTHYLPPGPINPMTVNDCTWSGQWNSMSDIAKLAWQWTLINRTILGTPDIAVFRFEDIFDPQSGAFADLCSVAASFPDHSFEVHDIRPLLANKHNASSAKSNAWLDWSDNDKAIVNKICGPLMARFGYDPL